VLGSDLTPTGDAATCLTPEQWSSIVDTYEAELYGGRVDACPPASRFR